MQRLPRRQASFQVRANQDGSVQLCLAVVAREAAGAVRRLIELAVFGPAGFLQPRVRGGILWRAGGPRSINLRVLYQLIKA